MLYAATQLSEEKKEELVYVMNYTTKDFSMDYLDDENKPHVASIPALEIKSFPAPIAQRVVNHLANFILNLEDFSYKTDPQEELKRIKEKVTIHE
jgi:hypothetical protein